MRDFLRAGQFLSALTFLSLEAGAAPSFTATDLGTFSAANTQGTRANAINDLGQLTGFSDVDGTVGHAFLYKNGTLSDLGSLGGKYSEGAAINSSGVVAGEANTFNNFFGYQAIFAVGGNVGSIGTLGGGRSYGTGINASGQIVGSSDTSTMNTVHAFRRDQDGTFLDLSTPFSGAGTNSYAYAINDLGAIVGEANTTGDTYSHAFIAFGFGFDLTPSLADNSAAYALNKADVPLSRIVGSTGTGTNERAAMFTVGQPYVSLTTSIAGATASRALGVNDAGTIVGYVTVGGTTRAFLYRSQDATPTMVDLNTLLPTGGTVTLTSATGINNKGQISAYGRDSALTPNYDRAYLVSPIIAPTPTPPPAAPTVAIAGKKNLKTAKTSLPIKGTADGSVTSVTYTIGKLSGSAIGTTAWKFTARLKPGKNVITVTAHGPGGDSAPAKITVTRK